MYQARLSTEFRFESNSVDNMLSDRVIIHSRRRPDENDDTLIMIVSRSYKCSKFQVTQAFSNSFGFGILSHVFIVHPTSPTTYTQEAKDAIVFK